MVLFVGDLSVQDAKVLSEIAKNKNVLEFGVGGSTQIFAQVAKYTLSLDTDTQWIDKTAHNLALLESHNSVSMILYDTFDFSGSYDVVFVDGIPEKRLDFAKEAWSCLAPGGVMLFHDTRRFEYFQEAAWIIQFYFLEVEGIQVNDQESNITVIKKRDCPLAYENWNETEGKPAWAYGVGERPKGVELWPTTN